MTSPQTILGRLTKQLDRLMKKQRTASQHYQEKDYDQIRSIGLQSNVDDTVYLACLVGLVIRHWTAELEVVGSNPALAKQRIKFLGLLSLPAGVGLIAVSGVAICANRQSAAAPGWKSP